MVIIITGSSRGIGYGLAKEFLLKGNQLILNGRDEKVLKQSIQDLKKISTEVYGFAGDTSKEITHKALLQRAVDHFGKVDIYINNAGIPQGHKDFVELSSDLIKSLININIIGLMIGTKISARFMLEQGFGKIFNMEGFGSDGRMMKKLTLYGTSKKAVNYFNSSLAKELDGTCVQICSINPGMVRTDFIETSMEEGNEKDKKQFKKVLRIMAEDVETVAPFIVKRILKSHKNNDRIKFLGPWKLFVKIFKLIIS